MEIITKQDFEEAIEQLKKHFEKKIEESTLGLDQTYSIRQIAAAWKITEKTARKAVKNLKPVNLTGTYKYRLSDLNDLLNRNTQQ